jgi:hypothetical protein
LAKPLVLGCNCDKGRQDVIPFQIHRRIPLIRRPFQQRDQAVGERDRVAADHVSVLAERDELTASLTQAKRERDLATQERDQVMAELDRLSAERDSVGQSARDADKALAEITGERNRLRAAYPDIELPATPLSFAPRRPATDDDRELVARLIAAYRAALETRTCAPGLFWEGWFFDIKRDVHDALIAGDVSAVQALLRDPGKTDLFYGFDNLCRSIPSRDTGVEHGAEIYSDLILLSEAVGARRLWNPAMPHATTPFLPVEPLMDMLSRFVGFPICFPNPFEGEVGLATSRGTASYRAVQALHQAWRIWQLSQGDAGARIAEIGGGLGRTALYAWQFGLRNYTLIDLPLTMVAQGYFLGRTLGPDNVCFYGEDRPGIRILPPAAFLDATDRYDLVLNVDSMTEMAAETARDYCEAIKMRASTFLSINHEANPCSVSALCAEVALPAISRAPYRMRQGYVEEVFWKPPAIAR